MRRSTTHRSLLVLFALASLLAGPACGNGEVERGAGDEAGDDTRYEGSFTVLESPEHGPQLCAFVLTSLPPQCGGLPITNWSWDDVDGEESMNGITWGAWHVTGTYHDGALTLTQVPDHRAEPRHPGPAFAPACDRPDVVDPDAGEAEWEAVGQDGHPLHIDDLVTMWVTGSGGGTDDFVASVVVRPGAARAAMAAVREQYQGPLCVVERDLPPESELRAVQAQVTDEAPTSPLGPVLSVAPDPVRGVVMAEVWVVEADAAAYTKQRWGDRVVLQPLLRRVG